MAGLNKVILMGNLTKDPEYKTTPSGVGVTTFSIAVGRRFAKQGDEVTADFFNVVAWRNTAEFVSKYFNKGRAIVVVGSLQNRSWTDQASGQKRYVTEVALDTFQILTPRGNGQANGNGYGAQGQQQQRNSFQNEYDQQQADDCDDLPF